MHKNRLEAFSDGVLAIIITIMVLEMKAPHESDFESLKPLLPAFMSYVLSFIYIGIYWNNHHHLLFTVKEVSGGILWANLHLLFWLSLIPFATLWNGENNFARGPLALYGIVLLMAGTAYFILQKQIIKKHGKNSNLAKALGKDYKGKFSMIFYLIAIVSTIYFSWIAEIIYILVALMWLIPDKRIENILAEKTE